MITKEEAIRELESEIKWAKLNFYPHVGKQHVEADKMAIEALEQNTGYWILQPSNKEQSDRDFIWWKCSKCGQVIYSETEKDRREFHAFCGGCGAKMYEGTK